MSLAHYAAVQQVAAASQEFEFNHHLDSFQIFWGLENFFSHSSLKRVLHFRYGIVVAEP